MQKTPSPVPPPDPTAAHADAAGGDPSRSGRTSRDMAISLIVLLIPLAFLVAVFRLRGGEDVVVVDPSTAIAEAQSAAAFAVSPARGLTGDWRPVSAVFRREAAGAVLRVGYVTPGGGAVQLIESNQPVEALLRQELGEHMRPVGTVTVAGRQWQSYEVRGSERALVLTGMDRTVIVIGLAELAELHILATAVG